ncbi:MAG: PD-(D/E)XK nuclease family protein [Pirellulaceae bacterium]|nr:PD-(D/E)XK nuclease family protein [Pirellulaceae bacterium]
MNWLRQQCADNLLTEKWLVCANLRTGQTWKDRVNLAGISTVNLHIKTLRSIALSLVGESLAASNRTYLGGSAAQSLVHDLVNSFLERNELEYFGQVLHSQGLARLLTRSIRDLSLAGIDVSGLADSRFQSAAKASDIRNLYRAYAETKMQRRLVDYADSLNAASQGIKAGSIRLPSNLVVLMPSDVQMSLRERGFIEELRQHVSIQEPAQESKCNEARAAATLSKLQCTFFSGYGEINEVRGVVQRLLQKDANQSLRMDDAEILYTDSTAYVPLLYEFLCEAPIQTADGSRQTLADNPPITFSEGIATIYSRPGRALRAWLRWIKSDGLQSKAVQMVREGILNRPNAEGQSDAEQIGYSRLASNLRRISIGFKQERYIPAIRVAIEQAEHLQQEFLARRDNDEGDEDKAGDSHDELFPRDYGLPALESILSMFEPMVEFAPKIGDSAKTVLANAKRFLLKCARCENKLDRYARNKLLDEIDGRLAALEFADESVEGTIAWLEELPIESRILGSGPQPGSIHASPIGGGAFSGRKNFFVIGMDANRFPKPARVDPLLLDSERSAISADLETSVQIADRNQRELVDALDRIAQSDCNSLHFSFSTRNLVEDREVSPSPSLVEFFRTARNSPSAHVDDLLAHIGRPTAFVSTDSDNWLGKNDGDLAELLTTADEQACRVKLESQHTSFQAERIAREQREAVHFNEYDGYVPEAGPELSPTNSNQVVSPSRLETFGTCPRRFFFKYGLGVQPPDEWNIDPERWLDPITLGKLVHGLFEKFLRKLTSDELIPNSERDLSTLLEFLEQEIAVYLQDFPSPTEDAFQRQHDWLVEACEIFLEKEQAYCLQSGARPWILEAAIGLDEEPKSPLDCREPITLGLRDGRLLRVGGRIDRVDRFCQNGSESYAIWDYKSGSAFEFSQEDPFKQGRKLQSFLYVGMLRHRLASIGKGNDVVTSFGYFFPNTKTEGLRLVWTAGDLKEGDGILQSICDLIQAGAFPATTNKEDCKFCNYNNVCKDAAFVAVESVRKASDTNNRKLLGAWHKLRQLDEQGAGQ